MSLIATLTATNNAAIESTTSPWRNHIHVMADGYRVVVYSNATNIVWQSSSSGGSWSTATTIVAGTVMGALIDSVVTGSTMWVFVSSGSTVLAYSLVYSGAGVFAAVSASTTVVSGLTGTTLSIRAIYDSVASTIDAQHTAGTTGVVALLVDQGSTWYFYILDIHTAATGGIKQVSSLSTGPGTTNPSGVTNMFSRKPGYYYVITCSTSSGLFAREFTYSQPSNNGTLATSYTGTALAAWLLESSTSTQFPRVGTIYESLGQVAFDGGGSTRYTPTKDSKAGGGWGYTLTPALSLTGTVTVPAGTWSVALPLTTYNARGTLGGICRVYQVINGIETIVGTLTAANIILTSATSYTVTYTASLAAINVTGTALYIEPDLNPESAVTYAFDGTNSGLINIAPGIPTLTIPAIPPNTTPWACAVGTLELVTGTMGTTTGVALIASDTTANPGIDLFTVNGGLIKNRTRSNAKSYSATQSIGTSVANLSAYGLSASLNTVTGDKAVFGLGTFAPNGVHVGFLQRTNNLWGTWTRLDGDAATAIAAFVGGSSTSLAKIGPTVAYSQTTATPTLRYEDNGFAAAQGAPGTPTGVGVYSTPGGFPDAFGVVSPFSTTDTTPWIGHAYSNTVVTDPLGSYDITISHPGVDWESGSVPAPANTFAGTLLLEQYGAIGAAPTNPTLTPGTTYTISVTDKDTVAGLVSGAGTATFTVYTAPVVTVHTPVPISSLTFTTTFDYTQAQGFSCTSYQLNIIDPQNSNAILWQSALIPASIASGTTNFTSASFDLSAAAFAHTIPNHYGLTLQVICWATPTGGNPQFAGQGTLVTSSSFPAPPLPHDLFAFAVPGADPLHGGFCRLRWVQDASGGAPTPDPATWNVYLRPAGGAFTLLETILPGASVTGIQQVDIYSIPNDTTCDIGVTVLDAHGIESDFAIWPNVQMDFRLGMWLNDLANPTTCVEVGMYGTASGQSTSGYPLEWERTQDKDIAPLFNRTVPVATVGVLYARHTSTNPTVILDTGYEAATLAQLRAWEQAGSVVQLRDALGNVLFCLFTMKESAERVPLYKSVTLEFFEADSGGVTGLVVRSN